MTPHMSQGTIHEQEATAMTTAIAEREAMKLNGSKLPTFNQCRMLVMLANTIAKSGIGDRRPERNFAIFLKGLELGIPPMEALESIVAADDGKLSLSASLMHAKLIESGKGKVVWLERTDEKVTGRFIRFSDADNHLDITWTMADEATRAGLANKATYKKYPRQLLTARVLSEGIALQFPEVDTARSYTTDELGIEVAGDDDMKFEDNTPERFKVATANGEQAPNKEESETKILPVATPATPTPITPATAVSPSFDAMAIVKTLIAWAGFTHEEWIAILKPYGVISAKELSQDRLKALIQSLFDRYTPFELRAAGMDLATIRAAGFTIVADEEDATKNPKVADAPNAAASASTENSSSKPLESKAA
jgi:hypothetical protein